MLKDASISLLVNSQLLINGRRKIYKVNFCLRVGYKLAFSSSTISAINEQLIITIEGEELMKVRKCAICRLTLSRGRRRV
jgi:hypothetical protein